MRKNPLLRRGLIVVLTAAVLAGCAGTRTFTETPGYPDLPQGGVLDVQVFRRQTELELTNTTASTLGPGTMWLNRWYSREMPAIAPGDSWRVKLPEFKDRYGESFRAGGFFATEDPETLGTADVEMGGRMVGLVVVGRYED